jgi:hypothetical protein
MPGDLLARIDRIMAELAELRAEVAAADVASEVSPDYAVDYAVDDLADANLLEVSTAAARFNRPQDSIRWMCRHRNCGVKRANRWMASAPRLSRYLNGG